ncbi:hypothetical protein BN1080_02059 [Planococcus massiliensis]|uniref:Lipoprotein n=1 Tax=Planococcus massiliensis TaxID=1499687 RepID=A0A098EMR9_9BACL|nr:hypothetical protein [Planococcus massiliensis]CEG23115.1 hypothetical protein BN1080_02059 [Planococcus massiliensis]
MDDKSKKALKGCGIGCFGLIFVIVLLVVVLVSCSVNSEEEEKTFGFKVENYEVALKESLSSKNFEIAKWQREYEENRYNITLTDGIYAFMFVNDNKEIVKVNTVASGAALLVKNKEVMAAFESLIESVDPSLSITQKMTILDKLGINGQSNMLDQETSYTLNGIYYLYQGDAESDTMALQAKPE